MSGRLYRSWSLNRGRQEEEEEEAEEEEEEDKGAYGDAKSIKISLNAPFHSISSGHFSSWLLNPSLSRGGVLFTLHSDGSILATFDVPVR